MSLPTFQFRNQPSCILSGETARIYGVYLRIGDIRKTEDSAFGCEAAADDSPGRELRESGRRFREAAEQRRKFHRGMTSLLRSSDVLCADDLRFHRRLSHTAAPQRIAKSPSFNQHARISPGTGIIVGPGQTKSPSFSESTLQRCG